LLAKLQAYLQEQQAAALPKSPLGAAIGYAWRNWVAPPRYTEDGRLKIDNNGAEQALRPIPDGTTHICLARHFCLDSMSNAVCGPLCVGGGGSRTVQFRVAGRSV